jgi:hypothetical protein
MRYRVRARDGHQAAHGLCHDIERGPVAIGRGSRALVPKTAERGIDQLRIHLAQCFIGKPKALHDPDAEILDDRIGVGDHLEQGRAPFFSLQI